MPALGPFLLLPGAADAVWPVRQWPSAQYQAVCMT